MSSADRDRTLWFLRNILPHEPALRGWLSRGVLPGVDADDIIQEAYSILAELESVDGIRHPASQRNVAADGHVRRTQQLLGFVFQLLNLLIQLRLHQELRYSFLHHIFQLIP